MGGERWELRWPESLELILTHTGPVLNSNSVTLVRFRLTTIKNYFCSIREVSIFSRNSSIHH